MLKLTLLLILLWSPSFVTEIYGDTDNFFAWRHQLIMLTGFLGLGYMCFATVLAARFRWIESKIKGLDKGYALHKKLGIAALISLFSHWLLAHSAKWLIEAEVIAMPNRKPPVIEGINWHGIAEQVGDISFKIFVIFCIISLVQAISYKKFRFTHKIAGILVFTGVFHSIFLLDWNIPSLAMNLAIIAVSIAGIYAACLSLTNKIGSKNKTTGHVISVKSFKAQADENMAIQFAIELTSEINYKEGQFAYLHFHDGEAAHPFSILDYNPERKVIEFAVKDLGDYTKTLVNNLKVGQKVSVEGGYGCFQISDFKHQVWVGAGIGIVPFISRLHWLKRQADKHPFKVEKIQLFYCVNSIREAFFVNELVEMVSHFDFIELELFIADQGELLDGEKIIQKMGNRFFELSFCGPAPFAEQLQTTLKLPDAQFHRELFNMR